MSALLLALAAALNTTSVAPQSGCAPAEVLPVAQPSPPPRPGFRKLGDLPDANHIRAVLRSVNGCPYAEVTRFHVSSPGGYVPGGVLVPLRNHRVETGWGR